MSALTSLLNSLEGRFTADDYHLRSAIRAWAKSGSITAPPAVFRALDLFRTDLEHGASRAKRMRVHGAHEQRARGLLVKACDEGALAVKWLVLASSAPDLATQATGWGKGKDAFKAATKSYDEARHAVGCRKTC